MNKNQKFISLNLKMIAATLLAVFLAVCMYVLCSWFNSFIIEAKFTSEEAVAYNVGRAYEDLEAYIEENHVRSDDTEKLKQWVQDHDDTYLTVYDNYTNLFEGGWFVDNSNAAPEEDLTDMDTTYSTNEEDIPKGDRIDESTFEEDVQNRIIQFADGRFYTYISVYKEQSWQRIMSYVALSLSFLTLFLTLLLYHRHVVKRIVSLSNEVALVGDGRLDYKIQGSRCDEIGALADSVETMRISIIQKHQNEKQAWEANNQLITSMSHDIRTPLTSMIGYLDIIEGKKYDSQEALDKYIASCREKAFQLKDLSDKLFQYFLVFGNKEHEKSMEVFDADILFEQLLSEHCAEIISYGYKVEFYFNIPEVDIRADISGLKRLFDNVFSNIMKYADKKENVCIYAETEENQVKILAINGIPEQSKKVESTRIGLKTCEKICSDLGGSFTYDEQERIFTVRILLPIYVSEDQEEDTPAEN